MNTHLIRIISTSLMFCSFPPTLTLSILSPPPFYTITPSLLFLFNVSLSLPRSTPCHPSIFTIPHPILPPLSLSLFYTISLPLSSTLLSLLHSLLHSLTFSISPLSSTHTFSYCPLSLSLSLSIAPLSPHTLSLSHTSSLPLFQSLLFFPIPSFFFTHCFPFSH